MSEFVLADSEYKDADCIKESLKELGYEHEDHQEPQTLFGYRGDERTQKANIIIRKKHVGTLSNDIGFLRKEDGTYQLIISEFDIGQAKTKQKLTVEMKQIYSKHVSLKTLKKMGCTLTSTKKLENGQIKIKARILR